jgi:hypothetical protein
MNWKFWKKDVQDGHDGNTQLKGAKLSKPKDLPEPVGRKMVVGMKMDPDVVWSLKYVSRPIEDRRNASEFRIFNPEKATHSGVMVKNWASLDDRSDLILYSGTYDKNSNSVDIQVHEPIFEMAS